MKKLIDKLNDNLLYQNVAENHRSLDNYLQIASVYAKVENAIAVLSDMNQNVSYIYYGKMALKLGLTPSENYQKILSIWEEDIFTHITPNDVEKKYIQELYFIHFLRTIPAEEKTNYQLVSTLKIHHLENVIMSHRMFYIAINPNGTVWLTLCLYSLSPEIYSDYIINTSSGEIHLLNTLTSNSIISPREKEILQLVNDGLMSKEIANQLSISINTVNRHRQNILEKLNVDNSIEACQVAKKLKLIL